MKPDIDSLIEELHADNPDLAVEDGVLRAVFSELMANQPVVAIDQAFRARLRSRLVRGAVAMPEKRVALPWWLVYTVPVGLTALLLLVIQPPYATAPVVQPTTDTTESQDGALPVDETIVPSEAPRGGSFDAAPSMLYMETAPAMKGGANDTARSFDTGMAEEDAVEIATPVGTTDFLTAEFALEAQAVRITHLSLSAPAFVSVTGPEGVVAVSGLFLPGEHVNVLLPLRGGVVARGAYTAILYYDNGDGSYTEGFEEMALDQAVTPIAVELIAP